MNAPPAWILSNHDTSRPATRYGGGAVGRARARAMMLVELALPGAVHLYNGEELGLPDAELPDTALRDPVWESSGRTERGRDGSRVPIPWEGGPPGYGFTRGTPWLPMPPEYGALTVAEQLEDTDSTLSLIRRALELRKTHPGFGGGRTVEWFGAPEGCLAFRRAGTTLVCALNGSRAPVPLPPGDLLLSSGPLAGNQLPPDTRRLARLTRSDQQRQGAHAAAQDRAVAGVQAQPGTGGRHPHGRVRPGLGEQPQAGQREQAAQGDPHRRSGGGVDGGHGLVQHRIRQRLPHPVGADRPQPVIDELGPLGGRPLPEPAPSRPPAAARPARARPSPGRRWARARRPAR